MGAKVYLHGHLFDTGCLAYERLSTAPKGVVDAYVKILVEREQDLIKHYEKCTQSNLPSKVQPSQTNAVTAHSTSPS